MVIRQVDEQVPSAGKRVAEEQRCGTCVHARAPEGLGWQTYFKCAPRGRRVAEDAPACGSWRQRPELEVEEEPTSWAVNGVEPIGIIIAQARERLHATQAEYAKQLGVSERTLQRWEGLKQVPQRGLAKAIGEVVGLSEEQVRRAIWTQRAVVSEEEERSGQPGSPP